MSTPKWSTPLGPRELQGMDTPTLLALLEHIENHPENLAPPGEFYKFTAKARKRKDAIAEQITHNMMMVKKAAGTWVEPAGYSGRKVNRRR